MPKIIKQPDLGAIIQRRALSIPATQTPVGQAISGLQRGPIPPSVQQAIMGLQRTPVSIQRGIPQRAPALGPPAAAERPFTLTEIQQRQRQGLLSPIQQRVLASQESQLRGGPPIPSPGRQLFPPAAQLPQPAPPLTEFPQPVQPTRGLSTPLSGFQQSIRDTVLNNFETQNLQAQERAKPILGQLAAPDVTQLPGFASLSPGGVSRAIALQEQGLSNLLQGYGQAIGGRTRRLEDIIKSAEKVQEQAIAREEREFGRQIDITKLQLQMPEGTPFTIQGKTYTGLKPLEAAATEKIHAIANPAGGVIFYDDAGNIKQTIDSFGNTSRGAFKAPGEPAGAYNFDIPLPNKAGTITTPIGTKTRTHVTGNEIDIVYPGGIGAPIPSFTGGTVTKVVTGLGRKEGSRSYGNMVIVRDETGVEHWYAHLSRTDLKTGDTINPGQIIGLQGNSGDTVGPTGVHLHYEVRQDGKNVNPQKYNEEYRKGTPLLRTEFPTLPTKIAGEVNDIAQKFITQPITKNFAEVATNIDFINRMDPNTATATDKMALIYTFARVMDPTSSVREGEYAGVGQNSRSYVEGLGLQAQRIFNNPGELTSANVRTLQKTLNDKLESFERQYLTFRKGFEGQIDILGVRRAGTSGREILDRLAQFATPIGLPEQVGEMTVRLKSTGQSGTIPANEFDPNIYDQI